MEVRHVGYAQSTSIPNRHRKLVVRGESLDLDSIREQLSGLNIQVETYPVQVQKANAHALIEVPPGGDVQATLDACRELLNARVKAEAVVKIIRNLSDGAVTSVYIELDTDQLPEAYELAKGPHEFVVEDVVGRITQIKIRNDRVPLRYDPDSVVSLIEEWLKQYAVAVGRVIRT